MNRHDAKGTIFFFGSIQEWVIGFTLGSAFPHVCENGTSGPGVLGVLAVY
jgi:hypothetical protein